MKIELHLIQSVPPANLNRDDTGAPKDVTFGGHRRARLSSQSLKRAIRTSDVFKQVLSQPTGLRTRKAAGYVKDLLTEADVPADEARILARAGMEALLSKTDPSNDDQTSVLYYAARAELADFAQHLAEARADVEPLLQAALDAEQAVHAAKAEPGDDEKAKAKAVKKAEDLAGKAITKLAKAKPIAALIKAFIKAQKGQTTAADIALFGRMLAEEPTLNIDGACQVAHALSVDRVAPQFDYFTAVDDLNQGDETGAGMIGTTGFNSACFYRYACIDATQLAANLGGDREGMKEAVRAFLTASAVVLPSGKQNSFAANVRPELVLAVVRHDRAPLSLVNAFAEPVKPGAEGLISAAVARLSGHWAAMETMYDGLLSEAQPADVFVATPHASALGEALQAKRKDRVADVIDGVIQALV